MTENLPSPKKKSRLGNIMRRERLNSTELNRISGKLSYFFIK